MDANEFESLFRLATEVAKAKAKAEAKKEAKKEATDDLIKKFIDEIGKDFNFTR